MFHYRFALILTLLLSAVLGPGCISDREPFVLLLDDTYTLQLLGTREDGFNSPDGIAPESERAVYIADHGDHIILKWEEETGLTNYGNAASELQSPESVVRTSDGTLYLTDDSTGGVWRLDTTGTLSLLAGPGRGLRSTEGIALAPDNSLIVGDGSCRTIFRVTRAGSVSVHIPPGNLIEKAEAMVFDTAGNLYIADDMQKKIFIVEPGHEPHVLIDSDNGIKTPESLAYLDGHLFIADGESGKLLRWSCAQHTMDTIAIFHGILEDLQSVAVGEHGTLFVTVRSKNPENGYLFRLKPRAGAARGS